MRCNFCKRLKFGPVEILLSIIICVGMYIANQYEMRDYYKQKAEQSKAQIDKNISVDSKSIPISRDR